MTTKKQTNLRVLSLLFCTFATCLFLFTTCLSVDEDFLDSKLIISDDNQTMFNKDGGSRVFEIESNRDWSVKIESGSEWLSVSPMKGSEKTTEITVTVKKNEGETRKASFKVSCASIDKTITLTQKGKDFPSLNYVAIKDIRSMYFDSGKSEIIIDEPLILKAVVTSDRIGANRSAKRDGFIQDEAGNGLAFRVTQNETLFDMGDELAINLEGSKLHYYEYAGILQLIFSRMDAEVIGQNRPVAPKQIAIEELQSSIFDGTLVEIKNVQFKKFKDLKYYSGEGNSTMRILESIDGESIDVKTYKNANFKNKILPAGSGSIVAIASYCKENWEFQIRNLDDVKMMSRDELTRFEPKIPGVTEEHVTIAALRTKLKDLDIYTDQNYIEGEVILNAFKGNVPDNIVYIADETAGIALFFSDENKETILNSVPIGAKVKVQLNGVKVKRINGLLQIGDDNTLTTESVTIIEEKSSIPLQPKGATINELLSGKYQSELVSINNVQFKNIDIRYAENSHIIDNIGTEIEVYTSDFAFFGAQIVKKGMGQIIVVASINNKPQLLIRAIDDLSAMTGDRFEVSGSYINVSKERLSFDNKGGKDCVAISANVYWEALCDASWMSVTPNSGVDSGEILISVQKFEGEERTGKVIIADGSIVKSIDVIQKGGGESVETAKDLFFSEYVEGSSYNKYLEIYNGTGEAVDLSNYIIELYVNGSMIPSRSHFLEGVLESDEVIVIGESRATIYDGTVSVSSVANFNGNDAIALIKIIDDDVKYVDIIGCIGEDPGKEWIDPLDNNISTLDRTLVRKPSVREGVSKNPNKGFPTLGTDWKVYPIDTSEFLGSHTMD